MNPSDCADATVPLEESPGPAPAGPDRFPATRRRPCPSSARRTTPAHRRQRRRAPIRRDCANPAPASTTMPARNSPDARARTAPAAPAPRPECSGSHRLAEKSGEVDDAVQIAANIGDAEIPRARQRHRRHRRHRDDFAGIRQPDQPLLAGAGQTQPRLFDLRGRLRREAGRQLLLERAKVEFGGAGHCSCDQPSAAILASNSSRFTGLTM